MNQPVQKILIRNGADIHMYEWERSYIPLKLLQGDNSHLYNRAISYIVNQLGTDSHSHILKNLNQFQMNSKFYYNAHFSTAIIWMGRVLVIWVSNLTESLEQTISLQNRLQPSAEVYLKILEWFYGYN